MSAQAVQGEGLLAQDVAVEQKLLGLPGQTRGQP